MLLPTTLVGSYPQPDWLIDRDLLSHVMPPRVRMQRLWRVPAAWLEQAQDDATRLAVMDQERVGLDIITDGEMRRESYSNRFATALEGVDLDRPGTVVSRSGHDVLVPRIIGPIRRREPVHVRDVSFLRQLTDRLIKITIPGPFTMSRLVQDNFYGSARDVGMACAAAVNDEVHDLFAAGADVVQLDEPYLQAAPNAAREYGAAVIDRALADVSSVTAVHTCFGYAALVKGRPADGYSFLSELADTRVSQVSVETAQSRLNCQTLEPLSTKVILLGVIDLSTNEVESAELVATRIRRALQYVRPDRLVVAPDCGLKYLQRDVALAKMQAMVDGARLVRDLLTS